MQTKNKELLDTIEKALAIAKEIQDANKTNNLDVHYLSEAKQIATMRAAHLKKVAEAKEPQKQQQQTNQPPPEQITREHMLKEFAGLKPKQLEQAKAHAEAVLAKEPDRADAKLAIEVLAELLAKK